MSQLNKEKCSQEVYKNGISVALLDIPRAAAESLCEQATAALGFPVDWHYIAGRVHVKALKPTEQHQSAPVYQLRNTAVGNVWRDADKEAYDSAANLAEYERRLLYTRPAQGEPVALPARLPMRSPQDRNLPKGYAQVWNACLAEVEKLGPLYTHADPAEVERLRKAVEFYCKLSNEVIGERDELRAQAAQHKLAMDAACAEIAERDALLRIASELLTTISRHTTTSPSQWCDHFQREVKDRIHRIDAALSASAEPANGSPEV